MPKSADNELNRTSTGHSVPVTHQEHPGHQHKLPIDPQDTQLPTDDGGYQSYRGADKLKGKTALITGGDSGIGRATAILFSIESLKAVTIVYLPEEQKDAEATKQDVEKYGGTCHLIASDLRTWDNCEKVVQEAISKMGNVNILVNNCAYQMMREDISEISVDQWIRTFDTNIHSFFYMSKLILPQMLRGDTIINNASINAYVGRPDLLDYTSTKGAVVSFTRGLHNQQIKKGIRVNAIAPGPVWTPLIPATMNDSAQEQFTSPMGRPSQPSEMATCMVFLASKDSASISGQTIHANGGVVVNG